mmetsp:Transcript_52483/g.136664  ORF Transcript_52483/g.136664 Transcript_52483/m.136664 type:complete len:214 (+) Transcript_52483:72-713(+)
MLRPRQLTAPGAVPERRGAGALASSPSTFIHSRGLRQRQAAPIFFSSSLISSRSSISPSSSASSSSVSSSHSLSLSASSSSSFCLSSFSLFLLSFSACSTLATFCFRACTSSAAFFSASFCRSFSSFRISHSSSGFATSVSQPGPPRPPEGASFEGRFTSPRIMAATREPPELAPGPLTAHAAVVFTSAVWPSGKPFFRFGAPAGLGVAGVSL